MGGSCLVIPIGFNPYFRKGNLLFNDVTFKKSADVIWLLYRSVADIKKSVLTKQFLNYHLKNREIRDIPHDVRGKANRGVPQGQRQRPLVAKWWYMGLREQGPLSAQDRRHASAGT